MCGPGVTEVRNTSPDSWLSVYLIWSGYCDILYCIGNRWKCKCVSHCVCISYVSYASYYNIIFLMIRYVSYLAYASYEEYVLDGSAPPVHVLWFLCCLWKFCFVGFYIRLVFLMLGCCIWFVNLLCRLSRGQVYYYFSSALLKLCRLNSGAHQWQHQQQQEPSSSNQKQTLVFLSSVACPSLWRSTIPLQVTISRRWLAISLGFLLINKS